MAGEGEYRCELRRILSALVRQGDRLVEAQGAYERLLYMPGGDRQTCYEAEAELVVAETGSREVVADARCVSRRVGARGDVDPELGKLIERIEHECEWLTNRIAEWPT